MVLSRDVKGVAEFVIVGGKYVSKPVRNKKETTGCCTTCNGPVTVVKGYTNQLWFEIHKHCPFGGLVDMSLFYSGIRYARVVKSRDVDGREKVPGRCGEERRFRAVVEINFMPIVILMVLRL